MIRRQKRNAALMEFLAWMETEDGKKIGPYIIEFSDYAIEDLITNLYEPLPYVCDAAAAVLLNWHAASEYLPAIRQRIAWLAAREDIRQIALDVQMRRLQELEKNRANL